jgi:type I restriction enzyme, S subunit
LINRDGERRPVSSAIRSKQKNKIYDYYGAAGIIDKVDDYLFDERLLLVGEDGANLLSRSKDNAFFANGKYWVNNHAHVLDATNKELLEFVAMVINAMKLDDYITGSAQPKLSQDNLNKIPIILPPLQEQIRIVKCVKHWFSLIDYIEENKDNLQDTIKQTKSKILDLAIHGKLVPQDPMDEPATELLKRINPKAEITCDNPHYRNLPKGWAVTTIKDMCENINGLWKGKKEPFVNVGVIRNANFTKDFKLDYSKIEYIDVEQRAFNQRHLKNGDLIVEKSGGSDNNPVGRAILYEGKDSVFSFSNFTMALRIKEKEILTSRYLYYFLLAEYRKGSMRLMQTQTTGLHNLILDKYMSMPVLLPPFSEQLRITEKIIQVSTCQYFLFFYP